MVDQEKLYKLFKDIQGDERCLYTDTFATCCYLHKEGETTAAIKLLRNLLKKINKIYSNVHTDFIHQIIESIPDHEQDYALAVPLRAEFRNLFMR